MDIWGSEEIKIKRWIKWAEHVRAGWTVKATIEEEARPDGKPYTYNNYYYGMKRIRELNKTGEIKRYLKK